MFSDSVFAATEELCCTSERIFVGG